MWWRKVIRPEIQLWTASPAEAGLETIQTTIRIATSIPMVFCSKVSSPPDPHRRVQGHGRVLADTGNLTNRSPLFRPQYYLSCWERSADTSCVLECRITAIDVAGALRSQQCSP